MKSQSALGRIGRSGKCQDSQCFSSWREFDAAHAEPFAIVLHRQLPLRTLIIFEHGVLQQAQDFDVARRFILDCEIG
jgi:hypothetical protein